jgi:RsiW-degrading membrane proteinase PrsW (M82 family)
VFAGLALWFGSIVLQTGVDTFVALWKVALLMGGLLLVTIPTRTVTVIELLAPFSLGSAMVGVALLAGQGLDLFLGTGNSRGRALGMPLVEESLKIAPVLWILWRQRRRRARTFGVSDVLLLAAASGAGFNWVEEAFILHAQHSSSFLGEFPTTEIVGSSHGVHLIAGHAIWTAIAGLMIGIAMALCGPLVQRLLIGVSGWVWAVMDHAANNYSVHYHDAFGSFLTFVTANGYISLYIFVLGGCFGWALDFYFAYVKFPARVGAKLPAFPASWEAAKTTWHSLYWRRQFAYAARNHRPWRLGSAVGR